MGLAQAKDRSLVVVHAGLRLSLQAICEIETPAAEGAGAMLVLMSGRSGAVLDFQRFAEYRVEVDGVPYKAMCLCIMSIGLHTRLLSFMVEEISTDELPAT